MPSAGEWGVGWPYKGDDGAIWLQNRKRFFQRIAPDSAEHSIVVAQHILKFLSFVINHFVGAEAAYQIDVCGAGRRSDLRSKMLGQLDRKRADTSGAGRYEHFLSWLEVGSLLERLP